MSHEYIMIIDFDSEYSETVAKKVRENNVYSEVHSCKSCINRAKINLPKGIIITSGVNIQDIEKLPLINKEIFDFKVPILAVGSGACILAKSLGGKVEAKQLYGKMQIKSCDNGMLTAIFLQEYCMTNQNILTTKLPQNFTVSAKNDQVKYAAFEDAANNIFAVQFQPENDNTSFGNQLFNNFLLKICGCTADWTSLNFIEYQIEAIKKAVGDKRAALAFSAGVDSTVAAVLAHRAIGDKLTCVFIDHAFMRQNESEEVIEFLKNQFSMNIIKIKASDNFIEKFKGITDSNAKVQIFEQEFISSLFLQIKKLENQSFLLQSAIYSDIINMQKYNSSQDEKAGFQQDKQTKSCEKSDDIRQLWPLAMLFKDEVKKIGIMLGLPKNIVNRQHFPPAGLLVRISGEITQQKLDILRACDSILSNKIKQSNISCLQGSYFTQLLQAQNSYPSLNTPILNIISIKSAPVAEKQKNNAEALQYALLKSISEDIKNKVKGVDRVVYEIT